MDDSGSNKMGRMAAFFDELEDADLGLGINPFLKLPSRRRYPSYYETIERPISFKCIRNAFESGKYSNSLELIFKDLKLMFQNCMCFNSPHSDIYETAASFFELVSQKESEWTQSGRHHEAVRIVKSSHENAKGGVVTRSMARGGALTRRDKTEVLRENIQTVNYSRCSVAEMRNVKIIFDCVFEHKSEGSGKLTWKSLEKYVEKIVRTNLKRNPLLMARLGEQDAVPPQLNVDFMQVKTKLANHEYRSEFDIIEDFRTIFNTVLKLNRADSLLAKDASILNNALTAQIEEIMPCTNDLKSEDKSRDESVKEDQTRDRSLIRTILNKLSKIKIKPEDQRPLCEQLMNLPTNACRNLETVKDLIDMKKIIKKAQSYKSINEFVLDMRQLILNICNDESSTLFRDALYLHFKFVEAYNEAIENFSDVSIAKNEICSMISKLIRRVIRTKDPDGRFYADSIFDRYKNTPKLKFNNEFIPSLQSLIVLIRRGCYENFDVLQTHFVSLMEFTRRSHHPTDQIYQDTLMLQSAFLYFREHLITGRLSTPALNRCHWLSYIESQCCTEEAFNETHNKTVQFDQRRDFIVDEETDGAKEYTLGDFLILKSYEIVCLTERSNEEIYSGRVFIRASQTTHSLFHSFLENEVFLTNRKLVFKKEDVNKKCMIIFYPIFLRYDVKYDQSLDLYLCESYYDSIATAFFKLRTWKVKTVQSDSLSSSSRIKPLLKRKRIGPLKGDSWCCIGDKSIITDTNNGDHLTVETEGGNKMLFSVGQGAILTSTALEMKLMGMDVKASETKLRFVIEIKNLWRTQNGAFASGPVHVDPVLVPHHAVDLFYENEFILLNNGESDHVINLAENNVKPCSITTETTQRTRLTTSRCDVVVLKRLKYDHQPKGGKLRKIRPRFSLAADSFEEEFHLSRIYPKLTPSPLLKLALTNAGMSIMESAVQVNQIMADSVQSVRQPEPPSAPTVTSPKKPRKSRSGHRKTVAGGQRRTHNGCGFLLFSTEVRPVIRQENPNIPFGVLSKRIGELWRGLSAEERSRYDVRAKEKALQERMAAEASAEANAVETAPAVDDPNVGHHQHLLASKHPPRALQNNNPIDSAQQIVCGHGQTIIVQKPNEPPRQYTLRRCLPPRIIYQEDTAEATAAPAVDHVRVLSDTNSLIKRRTVEVNDEVGRKSKRMAMSVVSSSSMVRGDEKGAARVESLFSLTTQKSGEKQSQLDSIMEPMNDDDIVNNDNNNNNNNRESLPRVLQPQFGYPITLPLLSYPDAVEQQGIRREVFRTVDILVNFVDFQVEQANKETAV
ncbi:hypothetical protein ACOME3_009272 [Neoechinorhynchus agilis]